MRLCDTSPRSKSMKALKCPRNKHIGFMQKYKGKYFHIVLFCQYNVYALATLCT